MTHPAHESIRRTAPRSLRSAAATALLSVVALAATAAAQPAPGAPANPFAACVQSFGPEELMSHGEKIARSCADAHLGTERPRTEFGSSGWDHHIERAVQRALERERLERDEIAERVREARLAREEYEPYVL